MKFNFPLVCFTDPGQPQVEQVLHEHVDHDERGEVEDYEEHPVASLHQRKAQEHDADYSQCELNIMS